MCRAGATPGRLMCTKPGPPHQRMALVPQPMNGLHLTTYSYPVKLKRYIKALATLRSL
jgi:hypothetical protein